MEMGTVEALSRTDLIRDPARTSGTTLPNLPQQGGIVLPLFVLLALIITVLAAPSRRRTKLWFNQRNRKEPIVTRRRRYWSGFT